MTSMQSQTMIHPQKLFRTKQVPYYAFIKLGTILQNNTWTRNGYIDRVFNIKKMRHIRHELIR